MGYWQVELPLAMPSIVAGVRVAAVAGVGSATIAAAIGAGGLGEYIYRGLSMVDTTVILAGAIPAALLALVGRSGAGKSTLLKLVNRLLLPVSGAVIVEDRDTRDWDPIRLRRRIGYVLQEVGLFPHMTVASNVGVVPRLEHWAEDRVAARTMELLDLVGLPAAQFATAWPDELSGGQRQRVGVARALAVDPPVLLMDEPFGALDPLTRAELHAEFRRIQSRVRKTVIIVTHDMGEAFALGDRVGVIEDGTLVACDRPMVVAASRDMRVRRLLDAVRLDRDALQRAD
ncbi:MAG: ABC transporter ATP-binding protein [Acidobacteria bacterium]|nr:MAG: ABC transporter ATP-binding protein [Acidobacteriota bacterium]